MAESKKGFWDKHPLATEFAIMTVSFFVALVAYNAYATYLAPHIMPAPKAVS